MNSLMIKVFSSLQRQSRTKKTSVPCLDGYGTCTSREWENMIRPQPVMRRKMSDPDIHHGNFHVLSNLVRNSRHNFSNKIKLRIFNSLIMVHQIYPIQC